MQDDEMSRNKVSVYLYNIHMRFCIQKSKGAKYQTDELKSFKCYRESAQCLALFKFPCESTLRKTNE